MTTWVGHWSADRNGRNIIQEWCNVLSLSWSPLASLNSTDRSRLGRPSLELLTSRIQPLIIIGSFEIVHEKHLTQAATATVGCKSTGKECDARYVGGEG
jgi:hypothetical protein